MKAVNGKCRMEYIQFTCVWSCNKNHNKHHNQFMQRKGATLGNNLEVLGQ